MRKFTVNPDDTFQLLVDPEKAHDAKAGWRKLLESCKPSDEPPHLPEIFEMVYATESWRKKNKQPVEIYFETQADLEQFSAWLDKPETLLELKK